MCLLNKSGGGGVAGGKAARNTPHLPPLIEKILFDGYTQTKRSLAQVMTTSRFIRINPHYFLSASRPYAKIWSIESTPRNNTASFLRSSMEEKIPGQLLVVTHSSRFWLSYAIIKKQAKLA
jgi:hypothetical protein